MRHIAAMLFVSVLGALPLSAQDLPPRPDDLTRLMAVVSNLQTRVASLEKQLSSVQAQAASQVGFTKVGDNYSLMLPDGNLSIRAGSLDLNVATALSLKAMTSVVVESASGLLLKAGSDGTLSSGGTLHLKGSLMQLNNGSRPALAYSAFVVCPADGGNAFVQLQPPQSTVLIP
jgi:hypothetical protein